MRRCRCGYPDRDYVNHTAEACLLVCHTSPLSPEPSPKPKRRTTLATASIRWREAVEAARKDARVTPSQENDLLNIVARATIILEDISIQQAALALRLDMMQIDVTALQERCSDLEILAIAHDESITELEADKS